MGLFLGEFFLRGCDKGERGGWGIGGDSLKGDRETKGPKSCYGAAGHRKKEKTSWV